MIVTVTLNPAIDRTLFVRRLTVGTLNRAEEVRKAPGGKGNNAALVVARMGRKCLATGFLSGHSGRYIENALTAENVPCDFVYTAGETRTNVKIVDRDTCVCTEMNEPGPAATQADYLLLEQKLLSVVRKEDVVVFSGSVPHGLPDDIYRQMICTVKAIGAGTLLDTAGPFLQNGLEALPTGIKPNIDELSRLMGREIRSVEDAADSAGELLKRGIEYVLISLGSGGAVLRTKRGAFYSPAADVSVVCTVGAGDVMTASMAFGLMENMTDEEMLKMASACAGAAVASKHFECISKNSIQTYMADTVISQI